jgi:Dolichyl-phosphate-mannose-protein mannosyltransferase
MRKPIDPLRLCITLATVIYLAFASQAALSFLITSPSPENGNVTIEVSGNQVAHAADSQDGLWVDALIVDGRLRRWGTADHTSEWEVEDRVPPTLLDRSSKSGVLTFRAKRFAALLRPAGWAGVIQVKRDDKLVQTRNVGASEGPFTLEDPAAPQSATMFMVALILFTGCAWWFGPWLIGRKSIPWLVFSLAALHLLYWASEPVGTNSDSTGYLDSFLSVIQGEPAYFPPGYPAFLGLVGSLTGRNFGSGVTLIQQGMVVLSAAWLYLLLRRILSEGVAFLAGILAGGVAPTFTLPQAVISETATCFAIIGALYFALRSSETGKMLFMVLAGAFMAWGGLLRVVPLVALFPAICLLHLWSPSRNNFRRLGITMAAALAILLLPIAWFGFRSGTPELADSTGFHLYNRVVEEQGLVNEEGPSTRRLIALMAGRDLRRISQEVSQQVGLDYAPAELLLRKVSLEGISKYPLPFLLGTFRLAWRTFMAPTNWIPYWASTTDALPRLEDASLLACTASSLAWREALEDFNRDAWPILCWAAIAGVLSSAFRRRQHPLVWAIAWIPVGYLLAGSSLEYFNSRYNAPVVPFVAVLAILPLDLLRRHSRKPAFSSEPLSEAQSSAGLAGVAAEPRADTR